MKAETQEWLIKGNIDVQASNALLETKQPILYDIIAYHYQQAVEKYLKALLVEQGVEPPKEHRIDILISLNQGYVSDVETLHEFDSITDYAVKTRYPGIAGEITETDIKFCQKAVSATAEIVNRHLEQTVENVHIKDRDDEDLHR
jgi:HEPN domain-containing protein